MGNKSKKDEVIYAFIDSQNLNLGVRSEGWKLDYRKLRLFLKNKYGVKQAYMFIGHVDGNEKLYIHLQECNFKLVFKPTIQDKDGNVKGNVDAELVLYSAAIKFKDYDKAIIISGDGDFRCLVEFLIDRDKFKLLLAPNKKYSSLLREFDKHILRISNFRKSIEYRKKGQKPKAIKKTRTNFRSKP
jgi:uncharacterized LabA/DUF88 family protein